MLRTMQLKTARLTLAALFIASVGVAVALLNFSARFHSKPVSFPDFMRDVVAGRIGEVTIAGQRVSGIYRGDREGFHTYAPPHYANLARDLNAQGILVIRR